MKWNSILEIPFMSKKKYLGTGKYSFSGKAYYLLDKNGDVLRDFALIDENSIMEYRPNDNAMTIGKTGKGTDFWNNKFVNKHRNKILENSAINYEVKNADSSIIKEINAHSIRNAPTVLSLDGFISGSNSSGADTRIEASPLVISETDFYGLRFINPLKKLRILKNNKKAHENYKISMNILEKAYKLSLSEYLNKFSHAKKYFYHYNPESYNIIFSKEEWRKLNVYYENLKKKQLPDELKSNIVNIHKTIDAYFSGLLKKKSLIKRLRGFQRFSLILEFNLNKEPVIKGLNEKVSNMDASHLIEVKNIKNDNELNLIADKDNGLLLPKNIHWKFDKDPSYILNNQFKFIENGKVVAEISNAYINEKRKRNILRRNEKI